MTIRQFITNLMGANPYDGFDATAWKLDVTGWQSRHPWFESIIAQTNPLAILEVGSWKGASAIHIARNALRFKRDAQVLCIDTWLGSHGALWCNPEYRKELLLKNGFPQQYYQFLANVVHSRLQDTIFPMPMTSYAATGVLLETSLRFDLVYIDAHHDEDEVYSDMKRCWQLLEPGGTMLGDDYLTTEPGVIAAVNHFVHEHRLYLRTSEEKWAVRKPPVS